MSTIRPISRTYFVEITEGTSVTIPVELSQDLGLHPGDRVEIQVKSEQAIVRRVPDTAGSSLRGLLSDYFSSREEVQRFLDDERSGWGSDEGSPLT